MISIIIPVYNQASKLKRCLDSIASQTYTDYEIIVVNDGSKDNIGKVFADFQSAHPDLKAILINQENRGSNPARNRKLKEKRGDFVLFCDGDLILEPIMLATMKKTLDEHPEASFVYSSFYYGRKKFRLFPFSPEKLRQMPFIHTTSLIRAYDFPGFDENIKRLQDWDLWLTMLDLGKQGVWIDQVLFRIPEGGYTMSSWLPKFAYTLLPWLKQVKRYKQAIAIIKAKHKL